MPHYKLNFDAINEKALQHSFAILRRWLPDGKIACGEYIARNPKRADRKAGSFKINLTSGKWADFATGDKGSGFISLASYLHNLETYEAAKQLAQMLGMVGVSHDQ